MGRFQSSRSRSYTRYDESNRRKTYYEHHYEERSSSRNRRENSHKSYKESSRLKRRELYNATRASARISSSPDQQSERSSPCYSPYRLSVDRDCTTKRTKSKKFYRATDNSSDQISSSDGGKSCDTIKRLHKRKKSRKKRQLRPNSSVLAMMIRDHVRTNDRMDREEVNRANLALRQLDPNTTDQARLMTEYLCSACSKPG